ncbi:MAG: glycosyltransferase family 2 protein [Eubacteriales bacterium]
MDVSILIINYRTPELVADCVRSVIEKTEDVSYEIIVVDNGSGDGSLQKMKSTLPESVRLIDAGHNLGFGRANNLAARYASGTYLFLLNSDTLLRNDAVSILFRYMEQNRSCGIAGGNLFSADGSPAGSFCRSFDSPESVRRAASWNGIVTGIRERRRRDRLPENERAHLLADQNFNTSGCAEEVAYVFGADLMISRSLFEELGGFDRDFFMYAEESELSFRVRKKGRAVMSVPEAEIIHLDGGSFGGQPGFKSRQYAMRQLGKMLFFEKCYGQESADLYRRMKRAELRRMYLLARLFRREALLSLTKQQISAFSRADRAYKERKEKTNGGNL